MTEDPKARAARKAGRTGMATARAAFVNSRVGPFDRAALDDAMALLLGIGGGSGGGTGGPAAATSPVSDVLRWVPIGPSVVRASDTTYHRATGRVRDIAINDTGTRAYAATGKGGVWYTEDAGAMWAPVGGWANRTRTTGGMNNAQACGSLLVAFGADAAHDFVMVGTGELATWDRPSRPVIGGLGVLAAQGPAVTAGVGGDPWEPQAGQGLMEGLGVFRLARKPGVTAGAVTAPADTVIAATNAGLFIGTRLPTGAPNAGMFSWSELAALGPFFGLAAPAKPIVTDLLWMPGGANGRIVVALAKGLESPTVPAPTGSGVAFSDDLGLSFHWVTGLDPTVPGTPVAGRMSFARAGTSDRVYVLGDQEPALPTANVAAVWSILAMSASPPVASTLGGVPGLWPLSGGPSQRDYDQCIAVDVVPGPPDTDRIYLGGSYHQVSPFDMEASLWCFDVTAGPALVPSVGISRVSAPPVGDSANVPGLIGDNVHPDVHVIRVGPPGSGLVWVGCDGGVYASTQSGRVFSFGSLSTGFAALEVNFLANHPTSSHYLVIGTQDNGPHGRVGDVVWQNMLDGDAGGMALHPIRSDIFLAQYVRGTWRVGQTISGYQDPLDRLTGTAPPRENNLSAFYSGAATVRRSSTVGRLALGTNRVWITDDLGTAAVNTWFALPFPGGPASDPRPGGADAAAQQNVGIPGGGALPVATGGTGPLGAVLTMKWASATELLVLFEKGVVRWTQSTATAQWSTRVLAAPAGVTLSPAVTGAPDPATTILTDLCPVPGGGDFYLVTSGDRAASPGDTCLFFDSATNTFQATDLRHQLDPPGSPGVLGPLDPALAVVVDPTVPTDVYVGTITGVWKGTRTPGVAAHGWTPLANGLPPAAAQDLGIWVDPAPTADSPRLLRAALQSRGVWEVDLAAASEPKRTYARVHARDDRRRLPTPMANPLRRPGTPDGVVFASPDVMVRPRSGPAISPTWQLPAGATMGLMGAQPYELWTFQTAFRWLFPSVTADGLWGVDLGELVALHRDNRGLPVTAEIDQALWNDVVGGLHLDATGTVTRNAGDPFAVYREPWQSRATLAAPATELDLLERVRFPGTVADVAQVFTEWSTVDVLIHHRDTRPLPAGEAFAILLFREARTASPLLTANLAAFPGFVADVIAADAASSPVPATPTGWTHVTNGASGLHRLTVPLDARMPRAVPINVNLTGITAGHQVMFLAFVGSSVDPCGTGPVRLPAAPTVADLTKRWPYAAARLVNVSARP